MELKPRSPLKYRADIDGLRAIAVVSVLFFHAGMGFRGGYVGVDVFFVISGFLITSLILKDLDEGRFRVLLFLERRIRRILPVLVLVVLGTLVVSWFRFLPLDLKELGKSVVAQSLLVSNVYFFRNSGYFAPAAELKPLLHTWSLAVEEQFYLIFPFILTAAKKKSDDAVAWICLLLGVASFVLSIYGSYHQPQATFFLLPARAWELLIGSLLAIYPARSPAPRVPTGLLSWMGLLSILFAVYYYDRTTRFPGLAALLPCGGAALIIWSNTCNLTAVGRLLASPPMVFLGLISYSLYLWHWPVIVFSTYGRLGSVPLDQRILLMLATLVLAILSWRFVETPFRRREFLKSRGAIFRFAGGTTMALLLGGLAVLLSDGVPSRIPVRARHYAAGATDRLRVEMVSHKLGLKEALADEFIGLGGGGTNSPVSLVIWGDSHAVAAMPVFDALCKDHTVRGVLAARASTPPLLGYKARFDTAWEAESIPFNNAVLDFIIRNRVRDVVLIACWSCNIELDHGPDRLRGSLISTIEALQKSGTRIWIMRGVPSLRGNVPNALATAVMAGRDPDEIGLPLSEHRQESMRQDPLFSGLATQFGNVTVLDATDLFLNRSNRCRVAEGGEALYYDENHLTAAGAMLLRPLFEPLFQGTTKGPSPDKSGDRR